MRGFVKILILIVSILPFASCTREQGPRPQPSQSAEIGEVGGSGGESLKSSAEHVDAVTSKLPEKVLRVLTRLEWYLSRADSNFNHEHGEGMHGLLVDLLAKSETIASIREGRLKFLVQDGPCLEMISGTICLSRDHLRRLSPSSLALETLGLVVKQIAYLVGKNSAEAAKVQSFVVKNPAMVWLDEDVAASND